jgi:hypothetical protein
MNGNRDGLRETIAFLPILPAEVTQCGIQVTPTGRDLMRDYANQLHHDAVGTGRQLEDLCKALIAAGREAARCSAGMMNAAAQAKVTEGCKAAVNVDHFGVAAFSAPASGRAPGGALSCGKSHSLAARSGTVFFRSKAVPGTLELRLKKDLTPIFPPQ